MQCPKCDGTLESKTFGGRYEVQRCDTCQGLWAHQDVLPQMKAQWMSDAVFDSGDASRGRELDSVPGKCPECSKDLERVADEKQKHIWLDACPSCDGVWFDAGEFTDWKHETLMDVLRGLVARVR
jgi:Zn-finger nucleic acid-binding protein